MISRLYPLGSLIFWFLSLCALIICGLCGPLPHSSGDVRALMPPSSPEVRDLEHMETLFGANLFDSLIIQLPQTLDEDTREKLDEIQEKLQELPGVEQVFSPADGYSSLGYPVRLLANPAQARSDQKLAGRFLIEIQSGLDDPQRQLLDQQLRELSSQYQSLSPIRSGVFSLSEAATRNVEKENKRWTPLCLLALFASLLFVFRDLKTSLVVFLPPLLTLIWVIAGLLLFDIQLSPISELVLPLLLVIGASYSSFVVARHITARKEARPESLAGLPLSITLAVSTTVAGFLSLLMLDIQAVIQFGVLMSIGTTLSGVFGLLLPPRLLLQDKNALQRLDKNLSRFSLNRKLWFTRNMAIFAACISLGVSVAASRIRVDTSAFDFLPQHGREILEFKRATEIFPGTHALSIVFEHKDGKEFSSGDFTLLDRASQILRTEKDVSWTTSAGDFLRFSEALSKKVLEADEDKRFGPLSITTNKRNATRIILETDNDGAAIVELSQRVRQRLGEILPKEFLDRSTFFTSSRELVISTTSLGLSRGLLSSVTVALGLVSFLLLVVFRSPVFALIGTLPSLFPILLCFGFVGTFFPIVNLGAAMVAAVALGMISDNTFHFTIAFRSAKKSLPDEEALLQAYEMSCAPFVSTALVLIVGFLPTTFSSLIPVRQFGIFLAFALLLGLAMNALLLPALFAPKQGSSGPETKNFS